MGWFLWGGVGAHHLWALLRRWLRIIPTPDKVLIIVLMTSCGFGLWSVSPPGAFGLPPGRHV